MHIIRLIATVVAFALFATSSALAAVCLDLPDVPAACHSTKRGTAAKLIECAPGVKHFAYIIYADPFGKYHGVKQANVKHLPTGADVRYYYGSGAMERRWGRAPDNQSGRLSGQVHYYRVLAKQPHGERWVRTPACDA